MDDRAGKAKVTRGAGKAKIRDAALMMQERRKCGWLWLWLANEAIRCIMSCLLSSRSNLKRWLVVGIKSISW